MVVQVALSAPEARANASLPARVSANGSPCLDLLRVPERQNVRNTFVTSYAEKIFASEAKNQAWIDSALYGSPQNRFYIEMENGFIKELNDVVLKDKDFVTALTNLQKEVFIEQFQNDFSDVSFRFYSDFKAIRIEILSPLTQGSFERMASTFRRANQKFIDHHLVKNSLRQEDLRLAPNWFSLGVGETADQAALAARGARKKKSRTQLFSDPDFQQHMLFQLAQVQDLHQELLDLFANTSLVESGRFKLPVYTWARKSSSAQKLLSELRIEYGAAQLNLQAAEKIKRLTDLANEFSPAVYIAKRETLTLHEAPYGVLSIDFLGLGAENLKATTESLLNVETLSQALLSTRASEQAVTQSFIDRKQAVTNVVNEYFNHRVKIKFSGDDGIIVPLREFWLRDQLFLIRELSKLSEEPFFRMTNLHQKAAQSEDHAQLISAAESMEKMLRPLIRQNMGSEMSRQLSLSVNVFMGDLEHEREVRLVITSGIDLKRVEKQTLVRLFQETVGSFQSSQKAHGEVLTYLAIEAYAITPSTSQPY